MILKSAPASVQPMWAHQRLRYVSATLSIHYAVLFAWRRSQAFKDAVERRGCPALAELVWRATIVVDGRRERWHSVVQ